MKTNFKKIITFLLVLLMFLTLIGCSSPTGDTDTANEPQSTEEVDIEETEKLEETEEAEEEQEVVEVVEAFPGAEYTAIDEGQISAMKEEVRTLESIEEATIDGEKAGYRILVAPKGYGGSMQVFTYIDLEGKVLQVEIGNHGETAGIGDAVENPQFLGGFNNISSNEAVTAVDGVAGATFSSEAVKDGIRRALNVYTDMIQ